MTELKNELFAASVDVWNRVPFTVNHHKWLLEWYKDGDDGRFFFSFVSPRKRRYSFYTERGVHGGGRVYGAEVDGADEVRIASWWEDWGDKAEKLHALLRHTPEHILYRLYVLLDAIG